MSDHKQGDEVPSAGAAAAPAPTAGEGEESMQHALKEKMLKLEAEIEQLKTKIASDETKADNTKNEGLELELRGTIKANTQRLTQRQARGQDRAAVGTR
jgi:hypothetical protein